MDASGKVQGPLRPTPVISLALLDLASFSKVQILKIILIFTYHMNIQMSYSIEGAAKLKKK